MRSEADILENGSPRGEIGATSRSSRVLLAEDDHTFRHLIARALRCSGFEVIEARNGLEFMETIVPIVVGPTDGMPIDLIISDVRMPCLTGLDVLDILRRANWATPVILITAFADDFTRSEATRLGVSALFDKPFDVSSLRNMALHLVR